MKSVSQQLKTIDDPFLILLTLLRRLLMKIKQTLIIASVLSAISAQSFAYNIYNKTNHSVQVTDKSGFGGINVTMSPNGSASCNPRARGCYGKISFAVHSTQANGAVVCTWDGNLSNNRGNYFVIRPTPNKVYPEPGSCNIEYYID